MQESKLKPTPIFRGKPNRLERLKKAIGQIPKEKARKFVFSSFVVLILIAVGFAGYFWRKASVLEKNPQEAAQEETSKLLADVSKLIVLPEGEVPTVATVTDLEALKDQPFFAKAKQGHKVLIYTNAKKAILYDPVAHKIVEVAPINLGGQTTASPSPRQ